MNRPRSNRLLCLAALAALASVAACAPTEEVLDADEEGLDERSDAIIGGSTPCHSPAFVGSLGSFKADGEYASNCTITLIQPDWAMTAGHCVWNASRSPAIVIPFDAYVCAGVDNLDECNAQNSARVNEAYIHPNWDGYFERGSDVALLHLERPLGNKVAKLARPGVPWLNTPPPGHFVRSMGFGYTQPGVPTNRDLSQIWQRVISDATCNEEWTEVQDWAIEQGLIPPEMRINFAPDAWQSIFSGTVSEGHTPCHGDSGGPVFDITGLVQVGIMAAGDPFCAGLVPFIFTEVKAISGWALGCSKGDASVCGEPFLKR